MMNMQNVLILSSSRFSGGQTFVSHTKKQIQNGQKQLHIRQANTRKLGKWPNCRIFLKENPSINVFRISNIDTTYQFLTLNFFSSCYNFFASRFKAPKIMIFCSFHSIFAAWWGVKASKSRVPR